VAKCGPRTPPDIEPFLLSRQRATLPRCGSSRVNGVADTIDQACGKRRVADREVHPLQALELGIDNCLCHLRTGRQSHTAKKSANESAAARGIAEALRCNKVRSVVVCVSLDSDCAALGNTHDAYLCCHGAAVVEVLEVEMVDVAVGIVGPHRCLTLGQSRQIESRECSNVRRTVWHDAKHVGKTRCLRKRHTLPEEVKVDADRRGGNKRKTR
jgi:hypothetical protein